MDTAPNADAVVADILAHAGARECGRCGKRSSVQAKSDGGYEYQLWFCFECGNEEHHAASLDAV